MSARHAIGIDLGGTNIKAGIIDADANVVLRDEIPTEAARGFEHVLSRMAGLVPQLLSQAGLAPTQVCGVGIGVPGPLSHARGLVHRAPNLPGWENVPIRDRFTHEVGLPVSVENDANAAAYGEFVAGAGRDVRDMVILTLGTGIGGGIIIDGRLWRGSFDNAGEIGHTIIRPGGRACPCGQAGCLERYASAGAIAERAAEAVRAGEPSSLAAPAAAEELTASDVEQAASAGDALAVRIWSEACESLALCCVNLQHTLNPQQVVLAGGLINAGERLLTPVRRHFDRLSWQIAPDRPEIVLATLGGNAGLIGAAALAQVELDVKR